jgi:flagellar capping protein FliD
VRAVRDNNNIDDIIGGVVLYLKKASPDEVTVTIDYNYETVQKSIMDWVNAYNQVMEYLSILTTPNLDTTALHERAEENQEERYLPAESSLSLLNPNSARSVWTLTPPISAGIVYARTDRHIHETCRRIRRRIR